MKPRRPLFTNFDRRIHGDRQKSSCLSYEIGFNIHLYKTGMSRVCIMKSYIVALIHETISVIAKRDSNLQIIMFIFTLRFWKMDFSSGGNNVSSHLISWVMLQQIWHEDYSGHVRHVYNIFFMVLKWFFYQNNIVLCLN